MANANKVPSDLGGGTNGHLGLVLSVTYYILISNIPYVKTQHPGNMPAVDPTNLPGTVIAREEFKDNTKLFQEENGVEEALHINWIKIFRHSISNTIEISTHRK